MGGRRPDAFRRRVRTQSAAPVVLPRALNEPDAPSWVVFDLDGTLLDSDAALVAPFVGLGVPEEEVAFGALLAEECDRHGLAVEDYLDRYDTASARPFPGVDELVAALDRWAVCSNKVGASARAELDRLGWEPVVALFAEDFGGTPKHLGPVLDAIGAPAADVLFVGDTAHDRQCAEAAGCHFALAGWNRRAVPAADDRVLGHPREVLRLLAAGTR